MDAPLPDTHAILPLAVLEAMRNLDSPTDEEAAEYVDFVRAILGQMESAILCRIR